MRMKQNHPPSGPNKKKESYIPYNKSILTRILAMQFAKNHVMILNHLTKKAIMAHLETSNTSHTMNGGLFVFVDKIFGEKRLTKRKLNE